MRVLVDLLGFTGRKGGTETYTRELYRAMGGLGGSTQYFGLASVEAQELDLDWFPGAIIPSEVSGEDRFAWARGELLAVSQAAKAVAADVIHGPASFGPWRPSSPMVVTVHDMFYFSDPDMIANQLYVEPVKWMQRNAVRRASEIVAVSDSTSRELSRILNVPTDRISVIPSAGPSTVPTLERRPSHPPFLLGTGNRLPHKNWDTVLLALASMPTDRRPRFVLTGGSDEDPLAPLVKRLRLEPWVELRGWVSAMELDDLRSAAALQVIPSRLEGFSLPILEAMSFGVPVLLSDIPVHREVAGDAAVYFPARDHRLLAQRIAATLTNSVLRRWLTEAGRDRAAKFSWAESARLTSEVLVRAADKVRR